MCWGLWNEGYPIARVLDHYPSGEEYTVILDHDSHARIIKKDFARIRLTEFDYPRPTELATFLIDLLRLEKTGLIGRFSISYSQYDFSFERDKYIGIRYVLIPDLSDIQEDSVELTDLLSLAKIAAKICLPNQVNSFSRCKSIGEILSLIAGLTFRKDNTTGAGKLIINLDEENHSMWVGYNSERFRIRANQHGYFIPSKKPDPKAHGIEIPIQISPYPDPNLVNPWIERALCWQGKTKIWNEGSSDGTIRNLVGTLAAEFRHAENSCYKYEVESNYDLKKGIATIRIERRDGNANAHDLWEAAVRNREMDVALNSSERVFEWKDGDIWKLEKIHEKDPFLLTIKSSPKNAKLSDSGYLKLASVPQRALMTRKEKLIRSGVRKESIRNLLQLQVNTRNSDEWRLSQRRNIMALQGPPGTGKTWTACQIVKDILRENPCARILVSSKEHLALDHLSNRIREALDNSFDVVRINHRESDVERDIDSEVLPEAITNRILKDISISEKNMREIGKLATWVEDLATRTASVVCTTTLDRTMENLQRSGETFDFTIIEEAGKSYPSELIGPVSISMNTLIIGDHLQLPPFELREIQKAIEDCINDGLNNWDDRDFRNSIERELVEVSTHHAKRKEFNPTSISDQIEAWLQPFQTIHMITKGDVLSNQWRMFQSLSDSVGEIFYGKSFSIKKINSVEDDQLPGVFGEYAERLLMADIPNGTESNRTKSYCNKAEAKFAAKHLEELLNSGCDAIAITPYKGQVDEIRENLPKKYRDNVRTVDGFQGKEADFILLSLVRSNKRTGSSRRWGFFRDPRRINVALSRAREGLVVISSIDHIENTDWAEDEGQLSEFLESVRNQGKIIQEVKN
ncbi:AAA domain-containing protein [Candidatus Poseidoniaceae archaeon]|nr:AAA domain-containing protein [Candidatus Poseidoniaceae archaeon]